MRENALQILACPTCHGALAHQEARETNLYCARCAKHYPIRGGIPQFVQRDELSGPNRRFAHLYDLFSHFYAAYSRIGLAFMGGEGRNRRDVLRRLEPQAGRVLEVSIGPGVNLPYLFEMPGVQEVWGLDISPGQLRRCADLVRRKGWPVRLVLGNAEELPFRDEAFDIVFHIGGINFFNDKKKAVDELIRVARPGTRIIIVDEQEKGARFYEGTLPGFKRSFKSKRPPVLPPVDLVPSAMEDLRLADVWGGWFYCLEFRKPR